MLALMDPCDGWPWAKPGWTRGWAADRSQPICIEGFDPRSVVPPILAKFLPYVRTDYHRWSHDTDWTLESGPDDAPSSIDIMVPYNYSGGSGPSWTSYGGDPGDPPELECGQPWFCNEFGERCEVSLIEAEQARVETWLWENPPEPDYGDDY